MFVGHGCIHSHFNNIPSIIKLRLGYEHTVVIKFLQKRYPLVRRPIQLAYLTVLSSVLILKSQLKNDLSLPPIFLVRQRHHASRDQGQHPCPFPSSVLLG